MRQLAPPRGRASPGRASERLPAASITERVLPRRGNLTMIPRPQAAAKACCSPHLHRLTPHAEALRRNVHCLHQQPGSHRQPTENHDDTHPTLRNIALDNRRALFPLLSPLFPSVTLPRESLTSQRRRAFFYTHKGGATAVAAAPPLCVLRLRGSACEVSALKRHSKSSVTEPSSKTASMA